MDDELLFQDAKAHLVRAALLVAPTQREINGFRAMVKQMGADELSDRAQCLYLAEAIKNGLRRDIWPT